MIDRFFLSLRWLLCGWCGIAVLAGKAAEPVPTPAAPPATAAAATAPAPSFEIAPPAAWVRPCVPDLTSQGESPSEGMAFLLLEQQENVEPRASYAHHAYRITSDNGLQNGSSVSVSFDPSYQKLTLHFIRILRGGLTLDRLKRPEIKVIQREREMEAFLYDGAFTAVCQLEDVRVGDVIEYAYTLEGANPVLQGKYFDTFSTEWPIAVQHAVARLVYPTARPLHFQTKNRSVQTSTTRQGDTTEWLWEDTNIPARHVDTNTPRGYMPFGNVQVSEFADWQQVVDWAVPLYRVDAPPSPDLKVEIARIRMAETPEETILAALRFVQEKIRYLGIEIGVGGQKPTAPTEVLRRRFGDCKDKTLLLGTILRECGFTATPALVGSVLREHVADRLPSPGGFDHVILQVQLGERTYWLDATRSFQHGPLAQIYSSRFGYALLLRPGNRELTRCEPSQESLPTKKIVETYDVGTHAEETKLEAVSEYHGYAAEITRGIFQTANKEDIQKNYLQYYSRRYSSVRSTGPVEYRELPGENACQVTEHYVIPEMWQASDDKSGYSLTIQPADVAAEMGTPGIRERTDPLAINYPTKVTEEIHVDMFQDWPVKTAKRDVSNAFFRFQHESKGSGRHLELDYSYESLKDEVPAADLPKYDAALREARESLGYTLTYLTAQQVAAERAKKPHVTEDQFNWPIALLLGVVLLVAITLALRFALSSERDTPLPPPGRHRSLDGLGGWLVVIMINLLVLPWLLVWNEIVISPAIFHVAAWQNLTVIGQPSYHPMWMPALLFDLIYNSVMAVFSILLLVLFFQKRAVWPRCFAVFVACSAVGAIVAHALNSQIPAVASHASHSADGPLRAVVSAIVWIPYAFLSKRVKYTFRH